VAIAEIYLQRQPAPDAVVGSSLGHYSALVMLKSLEYESTIKLMQQCGNVYDEHFQQYTTIITQRLAKDQLPGYLGELLKELLFVFDYSDGTSFTGLKNKIELIKTGLLAQGLKVEETTCLRLPFHSEQLQQAETATRVLIEAVPIQSPKAPFYSTFSVATIAEPAEIKLALKYLLSSPHLLYQTYLILKTAGYRNFVHMKPFAAVERAEIT
jgi:malonyl CoA-acyl carrier protein transacylase